MLKLATRALFIVFGFVLILDAVLPDKVEHVAIGRHSTSTTRDTSRSPFAEKHYRVEFDRGSIGSCDVGYSLYSRLNDGDEVMVSATKLMKRCTRMNKQGQTLYAGGAAGYLAPLAGIAMLLAAFGMFGLDERISFRP